MCGGTISSALPDRKRIGREMVGTILSVSHLFVMFRESCLANAGERCCTSESMLVNVFCAPKAAEGGRGHSLDESTSRHVVFNVEWIRALL